MGRVGELFDGSPVFTGRGIDLGPLAVETLEMRHIVDGPLRNPINHQFGMVETC